MFLFISTLRSTVPTAQLINTRNPVPPSCQRREEKVMISDLGSEITGVTHESGNERRRAWRREPWGRPRASEAGGSQVRRAVPGHQWGRRQESKVARSLEVTSKPDCCRTLPAGRLGWAEGELPPSPAVWYLALLIIIFPAAQSQLQFWSDSQYPPIIIFRSLLRGVRPPWH